MRHGIGQLAAPLILAAIIAGCSDTQETALEPPTPPPAEPQFTIGEQPPNTPEDPPPFSTRGVADLEFVEVCKAYEGVDGGPVNIDVSVVSHTGTDIDPFSVTLQDGECLDVWLHGGDGLDEVTVTENPVPDGYSVSWVKEVANNESPGCQEADSGSGSSATGLAGGDECGLSGALIRFTNTFEEPPPEGGEGCTPGYWKQEHHFDSWEGYAPTDAFDDVFDPDAVPLRRPESGTTSDITLAEGLRLRGGGVNALIRHTIAALLNAANSGVDYDLTEADVLAKYAAAIGGDVEAQKDEFAQFNEQGCPLN
jgi:hypothetical protein